MGIRLERQWRVGRGRPRAEFLDIASGLRVMRSLIRRNTPAAEFTARYTIASRSCIRVSWKEGPGREDLSLIRIRLPSLVCVDEDQRNAWLGAGDGGGIWWSEGRQGRGRMRGCNTFWERDNGILGWIMAGPLWGGFVSGDTTAFMDGTLFVGHR